MRHTSLLHHAALGVAGSILTALAPAQVPEGHAILGTYYEAAFKHFSGSPGLYLVSLPDGKVTPVTGLPPELTARGDFHAGCWSVKLRSSDGAILVGQIGVGVISVYEFHLRGSAIVPSRTKKAFLGVARKGVAGVTMGSMPDDRLYVNAGQLDAQGKIHRLETGPMSASFEAIVDLRPARPTVSPVLGVPQQGGVINDREFSPTGRHSYTLRNNFWYHAMSSATLRRWDLTTRTPCVLASWTRQTAVGMAVDDDGTVYVSTSNNVRGPTYAEHAIHTITPSRCDKPRIRSVKTGQLAATWGMAMDRRAGRLVLSFIGGTEPDVWDNSLAYADPVTGKVTRITSGPAGGWSRPSVNGLAINNIVESYGPSTDGANRYSFDNFPNPGGQPVVGDRSFWLTVRSEPAAAQLSAVLLAPDRGATSLLGATILTRLSSSTLIPIEPGRTSTLAVPIPNQARLRGTSVHAQSVHSESGRLAASRGLSFTIR